MLVVATGIVILVSRGDMERLAALRFAPGDLWSLGGAASFGLYSLFMRHRGTDLSVFGFSAATFGLGALFCVPPVLAEMCWLPPVQWEPAVIIGVLYAGVGCSFCSFCLWTAAISRIGPVRAGIVYYSMPVFAATGAHIVLGEAVNTAQVVGGLLPVFYFLNRKNTSLLHLCRPQFEGGVLLKACVNGSSELMTNLSMSLVNILYNYQLLRLAGENGVAAYGVIMYACFLFIAVYVGYAFGSAPIVSFHYGAGNRAEVHNLYEKSLRLIAVVAVTLTAASMVIIPYVARFFVGYDPELLALTSRAFRLYALSFVIMGFNVYASSFFTALGDGVTSALISFLRTLVFQIAAVLILPAILGIDGIWLAVTAAELAALAVSAAMFVTKDKVFHYRKA